MTIALSVLFGRVEDYAAGRKAQWWPGRDDPAVIRKAGDVVGRVLPRSLPPVRSLLIGAVIGVLLVNVLVPAATGEAAGAASTEPVSADGGLALPPAPSAKPDQADFGAATGDVAGTAAATDPVVAAQAPVAGGSAAPIDAAAASQRVQAVVDAWRTSAVVDGVELGVRLPDGTDVTVTSGAGTDGAPLDPGAQYPITSITKSMTAAITMELITEGKIGLDDPLPAIDSVPGLPYVGQVTIRQLLNHTAGVLPYDKSPAYAAARSGPLTAATALALIKDQPLEWAPGAQVGYSNSGYLTLGLLDEQLSGKTYEELLQTRIFGPAGMGDSRLDTTPTAGWAGFSAGGVVSTLADQLAWGDALYRRNAILDADSLAQMLDVDNQFNTGLGAFPTCPCSTVDGVKVYSSIGHNGGQTTIQYAPKQDIVIAVNLTESMWTADLSQADVAELLTAVEGAVGTE